jgi:hypothetical protein
VPDPDPSVLPGPGQWAVDDPGRWDRWAVPCPIKEEEVNRRKLKRHRKSRMDARTHERLPVLPTLVRTVNEHRRATPHAHNNSRNASPNCSANKHPPLTTRLLNGYMDRLLTAAQSDTAAFKQFLKVA